MVLNSKELDKLIDKYQFEADRNFRNYQETGMTRYDTASRKAEDLADTLRVVKTAADDHNKVLHYRSQLSLLASQAQRISDPGEAGHILKSLIALAEMDGLIRREVQNE